SGLPQNKHRDRNRDRLERDGEPVGARAVCIWPVGNLAGRGLQLANRQVDQRERKQGGKSSEAKGPGSSKAASSQSRPEYGEAGKEDRANGRARIHDFS